MPNPDTSQEPDSNIATISYSEDLNTVRIKVTGDISDTLEEVMDRLQVELQPQYKLIIEGEEQAQTKWTDFKFLYSDAWWSGYGKPKDLHVQNITFFGTKGNSDCYAFYTRDTLVTMKDVTIRGYSGDTDTELRIDKVNPQDFGSTRWVEKGGGGMRIRDADYTNKNHSSKNPTFQNVTVKDCCRGIRLQECNSMYVTECIVENVSDNGIYLASGTYKSDKGCQNCVIDKCEVTYAGNTGIMSIGGRKNTFNYCTVDYTFGSGGAIYNTKDEITITGCEFTRCNNGEPNAPHGNPTDSFNGAIVGMSVESTDSTAGVLVQYTNFVSGGDPNNASVFYKSTSTGKITSKDNRKSSAIGKWYHVDSEEIDFEISPLTSLSDVLKDMTLQPGPNKIIKNFKIFYDLTKSHVALPTAEEYSDAFAEYSAEAIRVAQMERVTEEQILAANNAAFILLLTKNALDQRKEALDQNSAYLRTLSEDEISVTAATLLSRYNTETYRDSYILHPDDQTAAVDVREEYLDKWSAPYIDGSEYSVNVDIVTKEWRITSSPAYGEHTILSGTINSDGSLLTGVPVGGPIGDKAMIEFPHAFKGAFGRRVVDKDGVGITQFDVKIAYNFPLQSLSDVLKDMTLQPGPNTLPNFKIFYDLTKSHVALPTAEEYSDAFAEYSAEAIRVAQMERVTEEQILAANNAAFILLLTKNALDQRKEALDQNSAYLHTLSEDEISATAAILLSRYNTETYINNLHPDDQTAAVDVREEYLDKWSAPYIDGSEYSLNVDIVTKEWRITSSPAYGEHTILSGTINSDGSLLTGVPVGGPIGDKAMIEFPHGFKGAFGRRVVDKDGVGITKFDVKIALNYYILAEVQIHDITADSITGNVSHGIQFRETVAHQLEGVTKDDVIITNVLKSHGMPPTIKFVVIVNSKEKQTEFSSLLDASINDDVFFDDLQSTGGVWGSITNVNYAPDTKILSYSDMDAIGRIVADDFVTNLTPFKLKQLLEAQRVLAEMRHTGTPVNIVSVTEAITDSLKKYHNIDTFKELLPQSLNVGEQGESFTIDIDSGGNMNLIGTSDIEIEVESGKDVILTTKDGEVKLIDTLSNSVTKDVAETRFRELTRVLATTNHESIQAAYYSLLNSIQNRMAIFKRGVLNETFIRIASCDESQEYNIRRLTSLKDKVINEIDPANPQGIETTFNNALTDYYASMNSHISSVVVSYIQEIEDFSVIAASLYTQKIAALNASIEQLNLIVNGLDSTTVYQGVYSLYNINNLIQLYRSTAIKQAQHFNARVANITTYLDSLTDDNALVEQ